MTPTLNLLGKRRFLPLFITQFLNAFNDNVFKMAMVMLATYTIYKDPEQDAFFNALAGGVFILPFFLFSALAGQLADSSDKARIARLVKTAEIFIMMVGAFGIYIHSIPLMLAALFAMGVHSSFFGPIKYAILPQHLGKDEVLAGTGLVEAGTYIAILAGTILGGLLPYQDAAIAVLVFAVLGRIAGQFIPAAPPEPDAPPLKIDWNILRSSWQQVSATMHIPRLFLAICSISFFWAIGAMLAAQFPPLVENVLGSDNTVATMFTALFSIGVAIGSIIINLLLKGKVSARFSPIAVIIMGLFVLHLWWTVSGWVPTPGSGEEGLLTWREFLAIGRGDWVLVDLLGIAVFGGIFVVPLYAFLTTTVSKSETARTVAANNIVNSGFMVVAAALLAGLTKLGFSVENTLLSVACACVIAAALAWKLHKACD